MSFAAGGVAGAILILVCAIWRHDNHTRQDFYVATGLMWSLVILGGVVFPALQAGHRALLDHTLWRVDIWMGLDPWALVHAVGSIPWLYHSLALVYFTLPFAFALTWVCERPANLLRAVLIGPALAFVFYHIVPAVGPIHVGDPLAPINCFPSMHVTWALLFARSARGTVLRPLLWLFAELTALAAVGSGEHYFIDLIAAVPFCYVVEALAAYRFRATQSAEALP